LIVIARLVRAIHDLRDQDKDQGGGAGVLSCNTEIMGGPDKPGHDAIS
jgi:hypothetical protein